ncbi:IS200/IS605 family accessory protein TnpB-related protein [Saccharococcus caldoxylosilyticus]|nr:hypothetical protein BV455_01161 [Parageobacillus caldoxylosilyticus]
MDRIAVSIVSKQGNFIKSKVFYCHELEYVKGNQRNNIVGETIRDVYDWLLQENVGAVVIENIQLRQRHDTDKRFHRFTHHFKKKKLTDIIIRRGMRLGFRVKKVNPAYTSVIGRFKYRKKYGLSVHENAALVIGRRGLGYQERLPKELIHIIKNESEAPFDCGVRVDGRILQAIKKRNETTSIYRDDVTQNREFQTRA